MILAFFLFSLIASALHAENSNEKPIVIVIASYNNAKWYQKNIESVLFQRYKNYRVIYIDDASTDGTRELVQVYIKHTYLRHRTTFIANEVRRGALYNQYHAIHSCADNEIIIILDGDDWFPHCDVLQIINQVYQDPAIWLTYGQFVEYPSKGIGFCKPMPLWVVEQNAFREFTHIPSHLRTFYAWLFKQIKKEDLLYEGEFLKMTGDIAAMFPMIEMARDGHFRFISDILLTYNAENSLNDHKVSKELQKKMDIHIREQERYPALDVQPVKNEMVIQESV